MNALWLLLVLVAWVVLSSQQQRQNMLKWQTNAGTQSHVAQTANRCGSPTLIEHQLPASLLYGVSFFITDSLRQSSGDRVSISLLVSSSRHIYIRRNHLLQLSIDLAQERDETNVVCIFSIFDTRSTDTDEHHCCSRERSCRKSSTLWPSSFLHVFWLPGRFGWMRYRDEWRRLQAALLARHVFDLLVLGLPALLARHG